MPRLGAWSAMLRGSYTPLGWSFSGGNGQARFLFFKSFASLSFGFASKQLAGCTILLVSHGISWLFLWFSLLLSRFSVFFIFHFHLFFLYFFCFLSFFPSVYSEFFGLFAWFLFCSFMVSIGLFFLTFLLFSLVFLSCLNGF